LRSNVPTMIIDPVILFREGVRCILDNAGFQPVWCSDVPPVAPVMEVSRQDAPLLIIGTDVGDAIEQIAEIRRLYPMARLVLMLEDMSKERVVLAIRCGIRTIISKGISCESLIGTLNLVMEGATVLPSNVLDALLEVPDIVPMTTPGLSGVQESDAIETSDACAEHNSGLTVREMGVLHWLRDGLPNKEIARRMVITEATVKVHVKAILRKTRMKNRTQVAMWASRLEPTRQTASASGTKASGANFGDGQRIMVEPFPLVGATTERHCARPA
jgi:two-component system nitrate/nitrite response regulator NarL